MVSRQRINSKKRKSRILWMSVGVLVVVLIALLLLLASSTLKPPVSLTSINKPVSQPVLRDLTSVSDATLQAVGAGSGVAAPHTITGSSLTSDGKPEVLYVGGEYCPYCAVERWSMIIALSRFGTFSGLEFMVSSSTDIPSNIPTFTFRNSSYASQYISFVPVEQWDRSGNVVTPLSGPQQAIFSTQNPGGSIPFVDFANSYLVVGAQVSSPNLIGGKNWTQVASQLDDPTSTIAKGVDAAANDMISAICKIDGGQPIGVCTQSYATIPLAYVGNGTSIGQGMFFMTTVEGMRRTWTG